VERIRKRFIDGGVEYAINERPRLGGKFKLDTKAEATLIPLACSDAPDGRSQWTMQLLANRLIEMGIVDSISDETVRRYLKKTGSGEKAVYAILDNMNVKCPHCQNEADQVKAGKTYSGSQRYKCKLCNRVYTPEPKQQGYEDAIRHQAVKLYVDGMNYRRIARHLGVDHKSVINWVKAYTSQLPDAPQPKAVIKAEMDELFTFIGSKKTGLYNDDRGS
jgi:transposase-like protein